VYCTVLRQRGKGPGFDSQQVQIFLPPSEAPRKGRVGLQTPFWRCSLTTLHGTNTTTKDPMQRIQISSKSELISFCSTGMHNWRGTDARCGCNMWRSDVHSQIPIHCRGYIIVRKQHMSWCFVPFLHSYIISVFTPNRPPLDDYHIPFSRLHVIHPATLLKHMPINHRLFPPFGPSQLPL
jgi:hypothetical protein